MRQLPYRTRLVLAYTALFALAMATFGTVAYLSVQWTLSAALQSRLDTTANAVFPIPDVRKGRVFFDPDDHQQYLQILNENRIDGATVDRDGRLILANVAAVPAEIRPHITGSTAHQGAVRIGAGTVDYRVAPILDGARVLGYVISWQPRTLYEETMRITLLALVASGLMVIAIAVAIGGTIVGSMLRPIENLNALMSAIEASDLSDRLEWDGPNDELGRLCSTFDRLLARLEAAFERERRFAADASHELRTPLSVMRAEIELALGRERDALAYRSTLERLRSECARLEALIESMLLSARSGSGLPHPLPVRLGEVAARAAACAEGLGNARGIAVRIDQQADPVVLADAHLLESALVALLDNALRFSPPGRAVTIGIAADGEHARLSVIDRGPGFSPEALRNGTERFWRDDPARSGPGTGLGLSIAEAIAERHGGSLRLHNAVDGTVVELELPRLVDPAVYEPPNSGVIGSTVASPA